MVKIVRRLPGGTYRLRSYGAVPCMELPSHIPNDLDYDWYAHKAETMLCNMGAMADSPVHVECTTSKCKLSRTSDKDEAASPRSDRVNLSRHQHERTRRTARKRTSLTSRQSCAPRMPS